MKVNSCCTNLDLVLRPDKCGTISDNNVTEMVLDANIVFLKGSTRNITFGSIKFLGHLLGKFLSASPHAALVLAGLALVLFWILFIINSLHTKKFHIYILTVTWHPRIFYIKASTHSTSTHTLISTSTHHIECSSVLLSQIHGVELL